MVYFFGFCLLGHAAPDSPAPVTPALKRVLLLFAERAELPAIRAIDGGLREAFAARGGVEVYAEYFDFARFPAAQHSGALVEFLRNRYGGLKLDLIIPAGHQALDFVLAESGKLFPGVPITYCGIERHQLAGKELPPDISGALLAYDFRRTIQLAIELQPGARQAFCVFGTSEFDREVGKDALAALAQFPHLRVRQVDTVPYADILEEARRLPPDSFVLYVSMLRDSAGQTRSSPAVAGELSAVSPVPVYGLAAHFLERGVLGGAMMDYLSHGRDAAVHAVARLDGKSAASVEAALSPLLVNWTALKKWGIPESRVPPQAIVRFKPVSFWEERRGTALGILSVVFIQAALIAGLLVNRARRRRVEGALAESEQRMALAAEAAQLGMWAWDISANESWMTEKGRALFGFQPGARVDYAELVDRIHPDDRAARDLAVKRAMDTRGEYEMDYRVQPPDGQVRWISARGRWMAGVNGAGPKLLGVSMDVTARKQAELEAAQRRSELNHLSRVALMGEMATSLAHELNQPLTAIVSNAGAAQRFIARGKMEPGELKELLADISADGRRAGEVIRGIKSMVRKVETERRPLDLNHIIAEVLRLARADALAHGCTLATDLDPALPRVHGDAVQLQQVLLNLIINAFDAMRRTSSDVCRIEITSRSPDPKSAVIEVRDFGPGLPADEPGRIFETFFSTKRDGMGMGLAIARFIAEAHAGTLTAENAEGGGARFRLRIPARLPAPAEVVA